MAGLGDISRWSRGVLAAAGVAAACELCLAQTASLKFQEAPAWVSDQTVYEVNLRQFSAEGNLAGFRAQLPRLKRLGVGTVWFMPVHPIGVQGRIGALGSPYAVKDYLKFNPELGKLDEFRELVSAMHAQGMLVILDWVAGHTALDHPWVTQHPDWYKRDAQGALMPPVPAWTDVAALKYDVPAMRGAMLDAMEFWVRDVGVDGFRCDTAEFVPLDFWNDARNRLRKIKPVFLLAEGANPQLMSYAFDAAYAWYLPENMEGIVRGTKTVSDLVNYFNAEASIVPPGGNRLNFTSNHDKNAFEGTTRELLGAGVGAFTVLTFTAPGIPLIYNGQECGTEHRLNLFARDPIVWREDDMGELYLKLTNLRKMHPALQSGEHTAPMKFALQPGSPSVLFFRRVSGKDEIAVALNLGPQAATVHLPADVSRWRVVLGSMPAVNGAGNITLPAWKYLVWSASTSAP